MIGLSRHISENWDLYQWRSQRHTLEANGVCSVLTSFALVYRMTFFYLIPLKVMTMKGEQSRVLKEEVTAYLRYYLSICLE